MEKHEQFFTPEQVDEQIEQRIGDLRATPESQFLLEIQQIARQVREEQGPSLRRVEDRLRKHVLTGVERTATAPSEQRQRSPSSQTIQQGRFNRMEKKQASKFGRRISMLVAILVTVVLVGSLIAVLSFTHRSTATQTGAAPTTPTSPTKTPTPAPSQTPNPALGKTLFVYPQKGTATDGSFMTVGWSADGKYISVSDLDIKLLNASNGQIVRTFGGTSSSVWASWSATGTNFVTSGGVAQTWDVQTGQVLATFTPKSAQASNTAHQGNPMARLSGGDMIYASAWAPNNKLIASAVDGVTYGYNVQIWNAATGAYIRTLQIKPGATANDYINQIAWSPDGKYLAASSPNNGVFVWDTTTWQRVYIKQGVSGVTWSPQGELIASTNGSQVQVWLATTGAVQFSFQGQAGSNSVDALAWAPNGKYIAASGHDVRIWNVTNDKLIYVYTGFGKHTYFSINSLSWAPDSTRLASMDTGMDVTTSRGGGASGTGTPIDSVRVWIAA